jgi:hypothetical protein
LLLAFAAPLGAQSATSDAALTVPNAVPLAAEAPAPAAQPAEASVPTMPTTAPASPESQSVAGAPITDARVGVHAPEHSRDAAAATAAAHANLGQARALMVVGVAGLLVGAIIGGTPGTIIMIGGAVIGLKGLYDYLQ